MNRRRKRIIQKSHGIFLSILDSDKTAIDTYIESNIESLQEKTEEGWTPLHFAVMYSKENCVVGLLEHRADPFAKDIEKKTPLHWAAFRNVTFSIFDKLVQLQAHTLDIRDAFGRTPLHYVCMNHVFDEELGVGEIYELILKLDLLLRMMAMLDVIDYEGNTPLMVLCKHIHNYVETEEINLQLLPNTLNALKSKSACGILLEMLLKHGVDALKQNEYGFSALQLACHSHCVEMINLLLPLYKGHDIPTDATGNTPMSVSFFGDMQCLSLHYKPVQSDWFPLSESKARFEDSLRPVLKNMKLSVNHEKQTFGSPVLHYAMMDLKCSSNIIKGLVGYGRADVNAKNFAGKTAICYGIETELMVPQSLKTVLLKNWKEKLHLLVQNGAELNSQDLSGHSPLHVAASHGDLNLMEFLIEHKAIVNQRNKCGSTPLHLLCLSTKEVGTLCLAADLLGASGADVNAQDCYGSSTLHYAIYSHSNELTKHLISKGADKEIKDKSGQDVYAYQAELERKGILKNFNQCTDITDSFLYPIHIDCVTS